MFINWYMFGVVTEVKKMEIANPEHYFYVSNGAVLKNLVELVSELRSMDSNTFTHHVNSDKNDFSNWIRDVFNDKNLANNIEKVKSKEEMALLIEKKIEVSDKKSGKRSKKEIISSIKENISHG
jgi:hypothetical protein